LKYFNNNFLISEEKSSRICFSEALHSFGKEYKNYQENRKTAEKLRTYKLHQPLLDSESLQI